MWWAKTGTGRVPSYQRRGQVGVVSFSFTCEGWAFVMGCEKTKHSTQRAKIVLQENGPVQWHRYRRLGTVTAVFSAKRKEVPAPTPPPSALTAGFLALLLETTEHPLQPPKSPLIGRREGGIAVLGADHRPRTSTLPHKVDGNFSWVGRPDTNQKSCGLHRSCRLD